MDLLLRVTLDYKTARIQENVDWESCQSKYSDIFEAFRAQYPRQPITGRDFPHDIDAITKLQLTTKMKNIRSKYRTAVDTGRKSGHGRVVYLYFELCSEIWGGSPATRALESGIETGSLETASLEEATDLSTTQGPSPSLDPPNDSSDSQESTGDGQTTAALKHRRELLQVG